jgi:hypothetical protein
MKAIDIVKGWGGVDDHGQQLPIWGGVFAQFLVGGLVCGFLSKIGKNTLKCVKCAKRKML